MAIPERELVDNALRRANDEAAQMVAHASANAPLAGVIVACTEALVRQIRDHDDTQATVIAAEAREDRHDLATIVGENLSPIVNSLQTIAGESRGKKGGFLG